MRNAVLSLIVASCLGCMGQNEIDVQHEPSVPQPLNPEVLVPETEVAEVGPAFVLPRDQVSVLPFQVRLAKVARVAGVGVNDPLLAGLRAARMELGDGDYANGIRPDKTWTAAKMATWVKALRPVCQSAQLKARFSLPNDLSAMVMTAHGRWADASDAQAVNEELAGMALSDDEKHEMVCLSVLSSTEFVSR